MFVWYVSMFFWLDHHPTYLVISYVYVVSIPATTHRQVLRRELARAKTAVGSYAPWRTRPLVLGPNWLDIARDVCIATLVLMTKKISKETSGFCWWESPAIKKNALSQHSRVRFVVQCASWVLILMNIEIIESPYVYNLGVTVASSFLLNPLGILGDPTWSQMHSPQQRCSIWSNIDKWQGLCIVKRRTIHACMHPSIHTYIDT